MIERLAWRTGGFVGTTAERTLRSVVRMLPGAQPPSRKPRLLRALPTVAGTALGLAAGAVTASGRSGADRSGSSSGGGGRTGGGSRSRNGSRAHNGTRSRNGSHARNGASGGGGSRPSGSGATRRAAGPTRDATKEMAEKSRQELYELARKAGIEGRSAMSKKELVKALSD